ncbi:Gibberellin 20 oxidase 1 [Quillaja saponaria]|uniref:Gibberellin 20 oxidase 1 n=1 Tax=Quillaja saponaria TaxID=32244 RepID=A0AAD7LZX9_QUISA|nr:Gibberellin 20 oxidase 1 [Quillaja saponaria]
MGDVDPVFIQAPEHRPKPSVILAERIPLIDLSPVNYHEDDRVSDPDAIKGLVEEIDRICKEWGFFQVINRRVPFG